MPAPKLTPELRSAFVEAIGVGAPVKAACQAVGIGVRTYRDWMARGKRGGEEDAPYVEFRAAVLQIRGQAVVDMLKIIKAAAPTCWQAAMTWLERRYPKDFGRVDPIRLREYEELKGRLEKLEALAEEQGSDPHRRNGR